MGFFRNVLLGDTYEFDIVIIEPFRVLLLQCSSIFARFDIGFLLVSEHQTLNVAILVLATSVIWRIPKHYHDWFVLFDFTRFL